MDKICLYPIYFMLNNDYLIIINLNQLMGIKQIANRMSHGLLFLINQAHNLLTNRNKYFTLLANPNRKLQNLLLLKDF